MSVYLKKRREGSTAKIVRANVDMLRSTQRYSRKQAQAIAERWAKKRKAPA